MSDSSDATRRKMMILVEDLKEIRDQGKRSLEESSQVAMFKGMYISLSSTYEKFESLYDELCDEIRENGDPVATAADHALRTRAKRYFHESNAYWSTLAESSSRQSTAQPTFGWSSCRTKPKLPTLELPKFSGDRTKWPRFKDTFISLVKNDPDLSDIDRFHYLVRSLEGNAAAVIAHVPVTDDNFMNAWTALMEAYDNKRLLATAYLEVLLNLKPLTQRPNAITLGRTVAQLAETVAAFKMLEIPDRADFMFFHLARRSLDMHTREEFELSNRETFPTFDMLIKYLRDRCTATELASGLTHVTFASHVGNSRTFRTPKKSGTPHAALLGNCQNAMQSPSQRNCSVQSKFESVNSMPKCYICKEPHLVINCSKFIGASLVERLRLLKTWRGCKNCLNPGHNVSTCRSKFRCQQCRRRHHTLLHGTGQGDSVPQRPVIHSQQPMSNAMSRNAIHTDAEKPAALQSTSFHHTDAMLGTAVCSIKDSKGNSQLIRLVIDSGSHFSFITRQFARQLGLVVEKHATDIWGIGGTPLEGFKGRTFCSLSSASPNKLQLNTKAIVLDTITSPLPGFTSPIDFWEPYLSYPLADPEFWTTRPVDFLLGCDLFSEIFTGEVITIAADKPRLLGTIFGYVVLGRVQEVSLSSSARALHVVPESSVELLQKELHRFWEIEEPPATSTLSPEDEQCEDLFRNTHYRLPDGRFVVKLPFRTTTPPVTGTRGMAIRRLENLEHKLERNSNLRSKYHAFMREYELLGHMEVTCKPGKCLIPHHCVLKGGGDKCKLRVVFDAAARTSMGSLNEHLLVGPKLQSNIVDVHLNFRLHKFVFTADVVKMYRQILVHPSDRQYQHILWRFNPAEPVTEYELKTVTYGTSCAPYLALRTLAQLVQDDGKDFPLGAAAVLQDTYVDDLATGSDSLESAQELLRQVVDLMARGKFSLSKWAANHPSILAACNDLEPSTSIHANERVSLDSHSSENHSVKILGLEWDPKVDCFLYNIDLPRTACTKRAVLSAVAKIYDPLGFVGPVVVVAKCLIQEAWKRGLEWDEEFPPNMCTTWQSFVDGLPQLRELSIPRWIMKDGHNVFSILIFCDASEKAYCASAYSRTMYLGHPQVKLLLAKTKLAPVKFTTIPRLELCAALLAARVWQSLQPFCQRLSSQVSVHFFSDSAVVLSWLRTPYHLLKTFVANRVVQIRELTSAGEWRHVASLDNPSDIGSRGASVSDLIHNSLWFSGPTWATLDSSEWPSDFTSPLPKIPDLKPDAGTALAAHSNEPYLITWMSRFSDFSRLIRTLAYVLRFIAHSRLSHTRFTCLPLGLDEIRNSTLVAIKLIQRYIFFQNKIPTPDKLAIPKHLISFSPFLHQSGVLMVGGRLQNSDVPWGTRHPILLPAKIHLSQLILSHYHRALLHPGPTILLSVVRMKYWILGARQAIRQLTRQCVVCRKLKAVPNQPIMGALPTSRFREGRAFLHVGIDFAGPLFIKDSQRRKATISKAYLCLLVCLSTKALHLELVSSLSTPALLAALDRFIGRRGLPEKIFSDNGTNFVGAANIMREFYKWYRTQSTVETIHSYALNKEIEWSFIPPHSPFFGGLWEAGVKSVKRLLRTTYGENAMTFEELSTLLTSIEAILNSRPLCPLSSDPNDLEYLSPGHFLIGSPLLAHPEPSLFDTAENRLTRWQLVTQKTQHFWQRWRKEYITTLQQRVKWRLPTPNLKVGDLVILIEPHAPRLHWPVGRVQKIFPGKDNVVRVVSVRTPSSTFKRPVNKLIPLFLPESDTRAPCTSDQNQCQL